MKLLPFSRGEKKSKVLPVYFFRFDFLTGRNWRSKDGFADCGRCTWPRELKILADHIHIPFLLSQTFHSILTIWSTIKHKNLPRPQFFFELSQNYLFSMFIYILSFQKMSSVFLYDISIEFYIIYLLHNEFQQCWRGSHLVTPFILQCSTLLARMVRS